MKTNIISRMNDVLLESLDNPICEQVFNDGMNTMLQFAHSHVKNYKRPEIAVQIIRENNFTHADNYTEIIEMILEDSFKRCDEVSYTESMRYTINRRNNESYRP